MDIIVQNNFEGRVLQHIKFTSQIWVKTEENLQILKNFWLRQEFPPRPQSEGTLSGGEDASSILVQWCLPGATLVGKARLYQKADGQEEALQPMWTVQLPLCRNPHCSNTTYRPQTWDSQGTKWCLSLQQGTCTRYRCPAHLSLVAGSSSVLM